MISIVQALALVYNYTYKARTKRSIMLKKLTITINEDVYNGLYAVIGKRKIGHFLEELARPHVIHQELEAAYQEMAHDEEREAEATLWSEHTLKDIDHETR
jgi:predicted CopG family antitoxin